jgi:nitroimidazol reductase NimA-like FMN-containing flavoprotein (pyridoxamine 5'-phosphate oxidase superfamily)
MIVKELNRLQMLEILSGSRLGRLACAREGQPYVVPITFSLSGNYLYSFSMAGQKIEWMRQNPKVCVQVDEFGELREWKSVVVYGTYEELPDRIGWKQERERAWTLLSKHTNWWEPGGLKPVIPPTATTSSHLFYRIVIEDLTGRQAFNE